MNSKEIQIGKFEYIICTNEKQEKYLYRYDTEYGIGIKLTFNDEINSDTKSKIIQMLSKQYIDKILISKETNIKGSLFH